jgi:hypothetical protein
MSNEIPERAFLKACHPESPNRNCTWTLCGPEPKEGAIEYVRVDLALKESAESIVNEAGKVGQLMNLAADSARREERSTIKSMLDDYFKHFFCTCHGSTRTGWSLCELSDHD